MKAIAIVELPDDAFDKGRWYLDKIVYTEKESLFDDYALEMWELKPLPSKLDAYGYLDVGNEDGLYEKGWNACLDEIIGEQNESRMDK